jgi:leader peptidase (prepilin peptidase) / N-methyltransferase
MTSRGIGLRSHATSPLELLSARRRLGIAVAVTVAAALVAATLVHVSPARAAALYAAVQVALVAIAVVDLATRRIPNLLVLVIALIGVVSRIAVERSALAESLVAGAVVLGIASLLAYAAKGGLGMGDVKLATALGLLLGKAVVAALFVGTALGAVAGLLIILRQGAAGRRSTLAYGPYLAAGGAVAILLSTPPPLL